MTRRLPLAAALSWTALLLTAAGCATPRISGRIVDQHGRPLRGAAVETDPFTDARLAGPDGYFHLASMVQRDRVSSLPVGTYALLVKKLGCEQEAPLQVDVARGDNPVGEVRLRCRELEVRLDDLEENEVKISIPTDDPIRGE